MEKINVGFIGCGRISDLHYLGYADHPAARLYAVCDVRAETAEKRRREWGAVKAYTDYRAMLGDPDLDAVEILTPHDLHEVMVVDAVRAGKHVALQKPMTIDLASADRILAAVKQAGVVFKVTDNYAFYPPLVKARELIAAGAIGQPANIRLKLISGGFGGWDVPPAAWEWRLKESAAGRGLQTFDHGHHLWTTAWYLLGPVEKVVSWIDSADGVVDCPAVIMWKYKDGIKYGQCEYAHAADLTIPSRYYANDEWIEVTGSRGLIIVHRCTGDIVSGPAVSLFTSRGWEHLSDLPCDWAEGFKGSSGNFIAAIRGEAEPLLTGDQAREVLRFALAISKSARVQREVYLAELDSRRPGFYAWRERRRARKRKEGDRGPWSRLGLGRGEARYAVQAETLTEELIGRFNAQAAQGWEAEIGLHLSAQGQTTELKFSLSLKGGQAHLTKGRLPDQADLLIKVPAGTWAAILLKKKRIETAFLQGRLKLEGKAEQALKLRAVFGL
ncbi:MAG: Gfo/Idh/MocA family oxidoreductase [Thermodesulfobacteriota bacterium]